MDQAARHTVFWDVYTKIAGNQLLRVVTNSEGYLDKAIDSYLKGFEADWRDAYPGINLVTLMEIKNHPDQRRFDIIPVVKYAFERKIASGEQDYWDHASKLELAVIMKQEKTAMTALSDTLVSAKAAWELETTANNLRLIREARHDRDEIVDWTNQAEEVVLKSANDMKKDSG